MNISSENIVDVFLRKISESLPVGERDEYQAWKKDQEWRASYAADDRKEKAIKIRMNRIAADCAYQLTKFFGFDDAGSKYSISSDDYGDIIFNDGSKHEIARVLTSGSISFEGAFEKVIKPYDLNYHLNGDDYSCFYLTVYGKREIVGPLYGKLKKLGFDPTRAGSSFGQRLNVTFNTNDFIEAIKKGLRITDFTDAQLE